MTPAEGGDWALFFELHRDLPREGPGDDDTTLRALSMVERALPDRPAVLDIGCGPGAQTLVLARAIRGTIIAVDKHRPYLDQLSARAKRERLSNRIRTVEASMHALPFAPDSFDLVWSEGAVWIAGFDYGLQEWSRLLRSGGFIVVSELAWVTPTPAPEEREFWSEAYPAMRSHRENVAAAQRLGFEVVGEAAVPHASWFTEYLGPLEGRLDAMQETYAKDAAILAWLTSQRREIDVVRRHRGFAYMFYVLRRRRDEDGAAGMGIEGRNRR
ncbi:MAG: methyltransferase domain-containing protein [Candidatus Eremiobacteraeota bacterium]|nr:methyltransferase domain-containing protein [Candidatus Eremiobacteraeota bacterium]